MEVTHVFKDEKMENSWKPFWRQVFVCSVVWTNYLMAGLIYGAPTVITAQMRREANSHDAVSDEMMSWLSSVTGYSSAPWTIIIPILIRYIGRRRTLMMVALFTIIGFIIFCLSKTPTYIIISDIMQGPLIACNISLSIIVVSEYTSPKYRGTFLTIKGATFFWGMWLANALGTFFYWKTIAVLGLICSFYTSTSFFYPESPQWLASRGRFDECKKAHRWLKGPSVEEEKELLMLIESQMNLTKTKFSFKEYANPLFYKSLFLCMLLMVTYNAMGKLVCMVYAIEMLKKISNDESAAFIGMLILDGVSIFSMYIGCYLSKILQRRKLLFSAYSIGILFLFIMAVYLFLIRLGIVYENKIVSLAFLTCFSIAISSGPINLCTSIVGEITPLRYKSTISFLTALTFSIVSASLLKIAPFMFKNAGIDGTFLFYGCFSCICYGLLYFKLPETKDMTLQEIEDFFVPKMKETEIAQAEALMAQNFSRH